MKILEIIPTLAAGGGERFIVDLSNELAKNKENEIELLTIKDDTVGNNGFNKKDLTTDVKYQCLNVKKYSFRTLVDMYKKLKEIKPDIVHFHLASAMNVLFLAIFFYRKPIYIQTLHGRADKQQTNYIGYVLRKIIYKFSLVKIKTISDDNDKKFNDFYKTKSCGVIYNGRTLLKPINLDSVKKEINSYKTDDDTLVFIHVARFHPEKNQELLINSFNKVISSGANVTLIILGAFFDTPAAKSLTEKADRNIHFLGLKSNVGDYLRNADAFVLSSYNEGMPISLIEAMSCKCALISTPVSGCVDIIKNGVNGYISKDFTEEEFIKAIFSYINSHSEIDKEDIYKYYVENLSIEKCAESYNSFFKECLKR